MKARLSVPLEHEPSFARLLAYRQNRDETFLSFRWVQCASSRSWFVDETYVKVAGRWRSVYRAVDQDR